MSIFNNEYPISRSYRIIDFDVGGRWYEAYGFILTPKKAQELDAEESKVVYNVGGEWAILGYPDEKLVLGDMSNFQPRNPDNVNYPTIFKLDYKTFGYKDKGLTCLLQTVPFALGSLQNVKALTSLNVAFESTGDIFPTLEVGYKDAFYAATNWVVIPPYVDRDGFVKYLLREVQPHKYFQFKLYWKNSETSYISKLHYISLVTENIKDVER